MVKLLDEAEEEVRGRRSAEELFEMTTDELVSGLCRVVVDEDAIGTVVVAVVEE